MWMRSMPAMARNQSRIRSRKKETLISKKSFQSWITSGPRAFFLSLIAAAGSLHAAPTFYKDVLPVLQEHCQSCHRAGEIGPLPLVSYQDARRWSTQIARRTAAREMPPWFADPRVGHFANDPSLSPAQIATLADWAKSGVPAGNPADAPPPRQWTADYVIPNPDLVVTMPQPVPIPAKGDIEYTYEIVHTNFAEDRWVRMSEIRPSNRAHVHHAVVYVRPPGAKWMANKP